MKLRSIISALLLASLLYGCGKDNPVYIREGCTPLSFSSSLVAGTKALKPDDPTVLLTVGNEASLFGTRVKNDTTQRIFSNRSLRYDAVPDPLTPAEPYSSVWNYSPLEYWKDDGDYYFTAVFPYSGEDNWIGDAFYLNVRYQTGSNQDMMVARAYRNAAVSTDPVELEFKHATSAVRFLFGKAASSDSDRYELTSFRLENIAAAGTFKIQTRITNPAVDPISLSMWTPGTVTTVASWNSTTGGGRKNIPHPSVASDPDGYLPMGWYYMVPHTLDAGAAVRFSLSYNDGEPVETVLNISDCDGVPGADTWIPNCVYNYFITLTQSGLDITVKAVPWDEVTVITDDIIFEG
ncbi:MAG: fimbrillin family protein [Bacteroidales bacterium]|nr:fimbrillin family protein [Bacteroidales bacterium]